MLKVNDREFVPDYFPDHTLLMKAEFAGVKEPIEISWYFEKNEELITLLFLVQHLREAGRKEISLFMPYIPNARQDRVKSSEEVFTLKYFAQVINGLEFQKVKVLDPHSYVSEALFQHIEVFHPDEYILNIAAMEKELLFFYPDEGAAKRYGSIFKYPFVFGIKNRDWKSGRIRGLEIAGDTTLIKDRDILIVDDICSKGGTFYYSAKKLKELGANNIYLYVSHCENTILDGELIGSGLVKKIYTTNSIFTKSHPIIEVIDIRKNREG